MAVRDELTNAILGGRSICRSQRSLNIKVFRRIIGAMATNATKRSVHIARTLKDVEDIHAIYRDTMRRYPKTMALLAE